MQLTPPAPLHSLDGIPHEVDENLLDLDPVGEHVRGARLKLQLHMNVECASPRHGERAGLLDHR